MIVIGLTGSIGMGKSTAASMFELEGVPVFDSDACVHKLMAPKGKAVREVVAHYPDVWDLKKRRIDRHKLGKVVFSDEDEKQRLEDILHPYVWKEQDAFIKNMRRAGFDMVVLDIPLLFETGAQKRVDVTVVVSAPPYIQYQRVMARPDMDEDKFFAILDSQMPDSGKRELADYIIPTGLGRAMTMRRIRELVRKIQRQASRGLYGTGGRYKCAR